MRLGRQKVWVFSVWDGDHFRVEAVYVTKKSALKAASYFARGDTMLSLVDLVPVSEED